jgi:calpain-7
MEICRIRNKSLRQKSPAMIKNINPYSIKQAYVTDCSFIASLCICSLFEKNFRKRLVTSIIYPQDKNGVPICNPEGKYYVKLWLNGVARVVTVDDLFPIDRHANLLCSHSSSSGHENQQQLELWVSLIEKAYMKLCGGYDFPGSNSGIDLFCLTGWIPEVSEVSSNHRFYLFEKL